MESRLVREKSRVARYGDFTDFSHSKSRFATLAPKMRRQIKGDTFVHICIYTQFFKANRMRPYLTGDDITIGRYTAGRRGHQTTNVHQNSGSLDRDIGRRSGRVR